MLIKRLSLTGCLLFGLILFGENNFTLAVPDNTNRARQAEYSQSDINDDVLRAVLEKYYAAGKKKSLYELLQTFSTGMREQIHKGLAFAASFKLLDPKYKQETELFKAKLAQFKQ